MNAYAVKVSPECMETPFWMDYNRDDCGNYYDGLTILNYDRHRTDIVKKTALFDLITGNAEDIAEAMDIFKEGRTCYFYPYCKNITEVFNFVLNPKRKLNTRDVHKLKKDFYHLVDGWSYFDVAEEIAEIMTILTGEKFDTADLNGYCQGDTVRIIYKVAEWTKEAIQELETEYWNGGTEYSVQLDGDEANFYFYTANWRDEEHEAEIKDSFGVDNVFFRDKYDFTEVDE